MNSLNTFRAMLMDYDKAVFGIASMICVTRSDCEALARVENPVLYVLGK